MHHRLLCLIAVATCLAAAEPPVLPGWGAEPEEASGAARSTVCLNGQWAFHPGGREAATGWGAIRVPGAWAARSHPMPGLVRAGAGPGWEGLGMDNRDTAWHRVDRAVYARRLRIPADWAGRSIALDLRRIGTDARVFIDGAAVGAAASPSGTVDLTGRVRPGTEPWLEVEVQAAASAAEVTVFMGAAADQVFRRKAELRCRGLLGDVLLTTAPAGARCSDVFVRTSVRQGRVDLDLELAGVPDGPLQAVARMLGPDGRAERTFTGACAVAGGAATIGWPWPDARRWDLGRPELYTLDLELSGAGFADRVQVGFGFKELWIDGRRIFLNGSEFHPRPYALVNESDRNWGQAELIDAAIDGLRGAGFDCQELWPWDQAERGTPSWHELWYERARAKGWGVVAPLQDSRQILGAAWRDPVRRAGWEAAVRAQMRRDRNNPAILMWVHTPNVYGLWNDQDPRILGQRAVMEAQSRAEGKDLVPGLEADAFIRRLDPTRPVFTHHGGAVGDIHTANTYPCLAQPQEQAEWISDWAERGEVPYWAIEFGPFVLDYRRGRLTGGWGQPFGAIHTELLATEHLAAWYGTAAYAAETPALRRLNPAYFERDQRYRQIPDSWKGGHQLAERHMAEQLADVFRSWRTLGAAVVPLPWEGEWGWNRSCNAQGEDISAKRIASPPFAPGRRGLWFPELPMNTARFLQPEGAQAMARADVFAAANGPTLAWICAPPAPGDDAAITAKDHAYPSGGTLVKAIALLNDSRATADAELAWTVEVAGRVVAQGGERMRMPTGTTQLAAVTAVLPVVAGKTDGAVACRAVIAGRVHTDRFAFRILPRPAPAGMAARILDPAGDTARLLAGLGVAAAADAPVRVVGRGALTSGAVRLADHEAWVRAGGRLLVMAQEPAWIRQAVGWRVGHQVLRRVFPCDPGHPVLAGLDDLDLRDWAGAGSLVAARPELDQAERGGARYPTHTWHWGNRGSVCSAPIEKPHRSAWRALLECDFDLAYTPLMELDVGAGRITWCQLDLESRGADDPAAAQLAANLLRHVAGAALAPRPPGVRYLGGDADRVLLTGLGVELGEAGPLVAGEGADPQVVAAEVAAGRPVVALAAGPLGLAAARTEAWPGPADLPAWPGLRGLTASDLRRSADGPQLLAQAAPGWDLAAGGLFARRGPALLCLADPRALPADEKTYYRLARWHLTRTLCQVLAGAGAGFAADRRIWAPSAAPPDAGIIPLAGTWAAKLTVPLPPAADPQAKHPDPGPSPAALAAAKPGFDDARWERVELPGRWARWGAAWAEHDGEAVFRRSVDLPAAVAARPELVLELGPIDDVDTVWVNGVEVGRTGTDQPEFWKRPRAYRIPPGIAVAGANLIVIRAMDLYGDGLVGDAAPGFRLRAPPPPRPDGWYHPDEELRHEVADDPHRYYRW